MRQEDHHAEQEQPEVPAGPGDAIPPSEEHAHDLHEPERELGRLYLPGPALALELWGDRAFVGLGLGGMALVDISEPRAPTLLAHYAAGDTLLLDTEWKVLSDGRLIIKQIRPFLRGGSSE